MQADDDLHFVEARPRAPHEGRWWHPLTYLSRVLRRALQNGIEGLSLDTSSCVVDFGCADQPYRESFPLGCRYLGADLPGNPKAEIVIDARGCMEVEGNQADAVLSSQVLEHVSDPDLYLSEALRVLKPGGQLLLSTHGVMFLHRDPVDYWRWTSDGLQKLLKDHGFEVLAIEGVLGLGASGLQLFLAASWRRMPRLLRPVWTVFWQSLILVCDRLESDAARRQDALVFIVHARKPAGSGDSGE